MAWIEHGSDLDRLSDKHAQLVHANAELLVATTGERTMALGHPRHFDCVEIATGRVHRGGLVDAIAACDRRAFAVPAGGSRVVVYRLPELAIESTYEVGARVTAVAADDASIVAAIAEAPTLVLIARDGARRTLELPATPTALRLSPDGRRLAVATVANTLVIVAVGDASVGKVLKGARSPIREIAFAGDDRVVAAAGKTILAWDLAAKTPRATTLVKAKHDVVLVGGTAGGLVLAQAYNEPLVAIDPATGATAWSIDQYGAAAADGERLISTRFHELRELDAATGAVRRTIALPLYLDAVAAAGPRIVACGRGSRVHVVDADATSWPVARGAGHDDNVLGIDSDGDRFATTGFDSAAIVWRYGDARPIVELRPPEAWRGEAIRLDGDTVLTTFDKGVQRWRIGDGRRLAATDPLKDDVTTVLPVPEHGLVLATSEATRRTYGELYLLDASTLAIVHEERLDTTYRRALRIDRDRVELRGAYRRLVVDVAARAVVEDHRITAPAGYHDPVLLAEDGSFIVELSNHPEIARGPFRGWFSARSLVDDRSLYDVVQTDEMYGPPDLSSDGRLATVHAEVVRIWDARTGRALETHALPVSPRGARWIRDGRAIACWSDTGVLLVRDA